MTTRKSDWHKIILSQFPRLGEELTLKLTDYCVQHSDIDFRKFITSGGESYLIEAIKVLKDISDLKIEFEVTKNPQKPIVFKIKVPSDFLELHGEALKNELTYYTIIETSKLIKEYVDKNNAKQIQVYQLFSDVMTLQSSVGIEMQITHKFI